MSKDNNKGCIAYAGGCLSDIAIVIGGGLTIVIVVGLGLWGIWHTITTPSLVKAWSKETIRRGIEDMSPEERQALKEYLSLLKTL